MRDTSLPSSQVRGLQECVTMTRLSMSSCLSDFSSFVSWSLGLAHLKLHMANNDLELNSVRVSVGGGEIDFEISSSDVLEITL